MSLKTQLCFNEIQLYSMRNKILYSIVHSQRRTSLKDEFVQNFLILPYNLPRAFPQMLFWGKKQECFDNTITKIFDEEIYLFLRQTCFFSNRPLKP